jgi:L-threonylcarbamoyladenylate synthase
MTHRLTPHDIAEAADVLRNGGMVAFPTETVYGLGANALDPVAVAKIFAAKQRPAWDPLIVHVSDAAMLEQVAILTPRAQRLIEAFWPGPLTLLLERTAAVPDEVTAARPLVGVRKPSHPIALALISTAGVPIAAPSANRFGHTSPTTAAHVLDDLDGRIDAVLDGGSTSVGVESTVFDPATLTLYRPGAITASMLEAALGEGPIIHFQPPILHPAQPESLPSPGVGIRHYAPQAQLILVHTEAELNGRLAEQKTLTGVMLPRSWTLHHPAEIFTWGSIDNPASLAQTLFAGLRELDQRGVTTILCPVPAAAGLGLAIQDRLEKASKSK